MKVLMENISTVDEQSLETKPDYITDERWEKIMRIRPLEDKKRSLLAGKLLHQMCRECGVKEPVYGNVKSGKPVLVNYPDIAFSISHSGEYVVLVYKKNITAVGIDIQQIKSMSDGLKKRFLHEKERLWLEDQMSVWENENNVEKQMLCLNRVWAVKEAFVKMTGEGLAHDFRNLYVDMKTQIVTDENGYQASFMELEAPEGYVLAVVIEE